MNGIPLDEETVFYVARRVSDPEARMAYLRQVCGDDTALRDRVEALLRVCEQEASFLESPAVGPPATVTAAGAARPPERPGAAIGPYKLLEPIGEGGMGTVYMAEQTHPVRRKVALKIIRPGMDTKQVIARFEAERQALALMDHPNIAKVLDAGTTEAGRPYFVMELVRGVPITDHCDREHLSIPERLDLFVLVCRAVQHAHQKGVIHRDIKPTNVLVTLHDGVPVPKVIDFGIAKATGQSLTDRTLHTGFAQLIGTPLYMSPEQAEMSGLDVDTRSDVYSLGVMLYELLTGTTPFDQETLRKAALDEVRRIIREEEPPRPSTRLCSLDETLTTVSANRKLDPRHLGRAVRGELDWVVMRALEKDRRRRYETANDLAADVMRYLTDRPVEACPASAWYRFGKFARRNRAALTTGGLVGLALVAGVALSTWQAVRATRAERESRRQAAVARTAVDAMYTQFAEKVLGDHPELDPVQREFLEKALAYYQAFSRERGTDPEIREEAARATSRVGKIRHQMEQYPEALAAFRQALELDEALARDFPDRPKPREFLAEDQRQIADLLWHLERYREARDAIVRAIEAQERLVGGHPGEARYRRGLAECQGYLGLVLLGSGRNDEAAKACGQARDLFARLVAEHPDEPDYRFMLGWVEQEFGTVLQRLGKRRESEDAYKRSIGHYEKLVGERRGRPEQRGGLATALKDLGGLLKEDAGKAQRAGKAPEAGKVREAEEAYRRSLAIQEGLVAEFPGRARYREHLAETSNDLGALLQGARRPAEAKPYYLRSVEIYEKRVAEFPTPTLRRKMAVPLMNLAFLAIKAGHHEEAERYARRSIDVLNKVESDFPGGVVAELGGQLHNNSADVLKGQGKPKEARRIYELAIALEHEALRADPKNARARANLFSHYWNLCTLTYLEAPDLCGRFARSALDQRPPESKSDFFWYFLGWAEYHRGNWRACIQALENYSDFPREGSFFGAIAQWHLGDKSAARATFTRADKKLRELEARGEDRVVPDLAVVRRQRAEAVALLGLSDPPAAEPKSPPGMKDRDR